MYKIDLAMKGLSDQIEALSKRGTIAQINAEYSDVGYFIATSESISDYTNGMVISLSLNQTNQGTVGLNINEIGTVQIVYATPEGQLQDITAGMMKQNSVYFCVYNGTYWVLSSAGYASTSNNVSDTINGKNITDIFEADGTTVKNATLQKQTEKLQTPVSIGLSGVTATAQQFDGSQGITIPITEVPGQIVEGAVDLAEDINKEWSEVDEITPAEPEAPRVADQLNGYTAQQIIDQTKEDLEPNIINTYIHTRSGQVNNLEGNGSNGKVLITSNIEPGDTWTVNGQPVNAYMGPNDATSAMSNNQYSGKWIYFSVQGSDVNFSGGSSNSNMKLLWQNENASQQFNSQSINIDSSEYTVFIVLAKNTTGGTAYTWNVCVKNVPNILICPTDLNRYREVTISDSQATFNNGRIINTYGKQPATENLDMIPISIYGVV